MKNILKLLCLLSFQLYTLSVDAAKLKVLFLGNSYTYTNDLPSLISSIATSKGDTVTYDSYCPGGYTIYQHSTDATTLAKIRSQAWDYIVIQEQSQIGAMYDDSALPDPSYFWLGPNLNLNDVIKSNQPRARVLYFMTWGRQNGDSEFCPSLDYMCNYNSMQSALRENYMFMANTNAASVAPVGVAWWKTRLSASGINLYSGDGSHPSVEGSYLAACTFYSSLFGKSATGSNFTSGLVSTVASTLQLYATKVVLDSISNWQLKFPFTTPKPSGTIYVKDDAFASYISTLVPNAIDANNFLDTAHTSLLEVTALNYNSLYYNPNLDNPPLRIIDGIQYFKNTKDIFLENNRILFTPVFPSNIDVLKLDYNSITTVTSLPNQIAKRLSIGNNKISHFLTSITGGLTNVNLSYNKLTALPSMSNTVTLLSAFSNYMVSIPVLINNIRELNLSNNRFNANWTSFPDSLRILDLSNNIGSGMTITAAWPLKIEEISIQYSNIATINTLPQSLKNLQVQNNNIQTMPMLPSGLTVLTWNNNPVQCLPNIPSGISHLDKGLKLCAQMATTTNTFCGQAILKSNASKATTWFIENEWYLNGNLIPLAKDSILITSLSGIYTFKTKTHPGWGTITSDISNSLSITGFLPTSIVTQPLANHTICGGTTSTISVSAVGQNLNYQWNNSTINSSLLTISLPGIYIVTVSGLCGNAISNPTTVTSIFSHQIVSQPVSQTVCGNNQAMLSVSATGNNLSFLWNNGETTSTINTSIAGVYVVTVSGDCGHVISDEITLVSTDCLISASTQSFVEENIWMELYPNPNSGVFSVDVLESKNKFAIFSSLGVICMEGELNKGINKIKFDGSRGMYFFKVKNKVTKLFVE